VYFKYQSRVDIDYVIGLERLLAPDTQHLETTFRFKLRSAAILPLEFSKSRRRQQFMSKMYSLRSSVVHGSAKREELDEILPQAEKGFTEIFKWFAHRLMVENNIENVIRKIDDSMVDGGYKWSAKRNRFR